MTARNPALWLAVLLAAATVAADTVVTGKEVIRCSVVSCDTNFTRLKLPSGGVRMLYTRDISEIRLSDSSRVAELATQLPQLSITLDSCRSVPTSAVGVQETEPPQPDAAPKPNQESSPLSAGVLDTLPRNASPADMATRCRDLKTALVGCGRGDNTVIELFREAGAEADALRQIRPRTATCLSAALGGLLGAPVGCAVGLAIDPVDLIANDSGKGNYVGFCLGLAGGGLLGAMLGAVMRTDSRNALLDRHRGRVNDLVRRVNLAVVTAP